MKYTSISILFTFSFFFIFSFSGCKKTNLNQSPPEIAFKNSLGYVSSDRTLSTNEEFIVGINAFSNVSSHSILKVLRITHQFLSTDQSYTYDNDTTLNVNAFSKDFKFTSSSSVGTEKITFSIIDDLENQSEIFIIITTTEEINKPPLIQFNTSSGFIFENNTLNLGESFSIGIIADANHETNMPLRKLEMNRQFNNINTYQTSSFDTLVSDFHIQINFDLVAMIEDGTESFTFTIYDYNGFSSSISLIIKTEYQIGALNVWEDLFLGDQDSYYNSFLMIKSGNIVDLEIAHAICNDIDLIYYYGDNTNATICAPSASSAAEIFNNPLHGVHLWEHRNSTYFKATELSMEEFDAIPETNDTQVVNHASGSDQLEIVNLSDSLCPRVWGFETNSGKLGLIKIQEIIIGDSNTQGTILFTVKVQQ